MPKIVALTAPSGSGKTTIARRVLQAVPEMTFSVSATTRPRRDYERHGVHYYFVSADEFRTLIDDDALLEFEEVYPGKFYGTLRAEVERVAAERPVLLDIEVHGALNVKRIFGDDALAIFIRPPSMDVLEQRLRARATETEQTLAVRLARVTHELSFADRFDHVVINDDLETAVAETLAHIRAFLAA